MKQYARRVLLAHRIVWVFLVGATLVVGLPGVNHAAESSQGTAILEELRIFNVLGTLLYIAAHPDDENTQLITFGAKGRRYRTGYLSITRGDGGQNVLGPEFNEALGLIRTQELLAARQLDGGRQFFTRAIDFGYSKSPYETLEIWGRDLVLGDVVRVIRTFRPDVIVTRFSPQPSGTHGHHTASAILALEAFRLSGDTGAYPEQLDVLEPWQPTRILQNGRLGRGDFTGEEGLRIQVDGQDPVTGEYFSTIAGQSRAMHKSQGFGAFGGRGGSGGDRYESFSLLAGEAAKEDIFDGIDTTWARVPGGEPVGRMTDAVINRFDSANPTASVPALLEIKRRIAQLPDNPLVREKRKDLDRIIQHCLGLTVETIVDSAELVPGEQFKLIHTANLASGVVPVQWVQINYMVSGMKNKAVSVTMKPSKPAGRKVSRSLPSDMPLSQPYWLCSAPETGTYHVQDPTLIGLADNPATFPIEWEFEVDGQTLFIPDEPVQPAGAIPESGSQIKMKVIPPVWLEWASDILLFAPGSTRRVKVSVMASRPDTAGTLRLEVPGGWLVEPAAREVRFRASGDPTWFEFDVTAPNRVTRAVITATVKVGERTYSNDRVDIQYSHIPPQLLQPTAKIEAVSFEMSKRGKRVGYVPGAGDSVGKSLTEMGYDVTIIHAAEISPERFEGLDAVVVGIRAFETQEVLKSKVPALFDYVKSGGTIVMQYSRENGLESAPLPLRISRNRITDENAPVTFLAPEHPVLHTPNKITPADFEGWIQERSIYVPDKWADAYVPILAANDPDEEPLFGQLLVAKHGEGFFVYTSLVFFRELPAGVPGAYRLFVNLVSLGKE